MSNSVISVMPGWIREELRLGVPAWSDSWNVRGRLGDGDWEPATDLVDAGDRLVAEIELPGVDRESVEITLENRVLSVRAQSKKRSVEGEDLICCERPRGTFSRSFEFETDVDSAKVEATYVDGVLQIVLPKAESAKPHKINVVAK